MEKATWIRGPELRERWGGMSPSTFYWRQKRGLIPSPQYPFGQRTPYWRLADIEAHEARSENGKINPPIKQRRS